MGNDHPVACLMNSCESPRKVSCCREFRESEMCEAVPNRDDASMTVSKAFPPKSLASMGIKFRNRYIYIYKVGESIECPSETSDKDVCDCKEGKGNWPFYREGLEIGAVTDDGHQCVFNTGDGQPSWT